MVALIPDQICHQFCSIPLAIGLFVSVSVLAAFCAKHTRRRQQLPPRKTEPNPSDSSKLHQKSPLMSPRHIVTSLGSKANPFINRNNGKDESGAEFGAKVDQDESGEDGLWQKSILMGDKCRPPEFSGVIYYDSRGNQLSELPPRSPRASPLPSYLTRTGNNVH